MGVFLFYLDLGIPYTADYLAAPDTDQTRRLLHALREPVGAFAIYIALLDDEDLSAGARSHVDAMLVNVEHMMKALTAITSAFSLEVGDSTPLALLSKQRNPNSVHR